MIIYLVTNLINSKVYVGKTERTLQERWNSHCREAYCKNCKSYFHRSIKKHGKDSFLCRCLIKTADKNELNNLEISYIAKYDSMNPKIGYNGTIGGTGGRLNKNSLLKLSNSLKKRWEGIPRPVSEETKQKISIANMGHKTSNATRIKISNIHKGKIASEETRQKMSASGKIKIFTEEHRKHLSDSLKNRVFTEKWRNSLIIARAKHPPMSEETKMKISKARMGQIRSEETKQKIRNTMYTNNRLKIMIRTK